MTGDERRVLNTGELAFVSAGTVHTFANRGPGNSRILVVMTPEIDRLITALHDAGTAAEKDAVWARFNASVVQAGA